MTSTLLLLLLFSFVAQVTAQNITVVNTTKSYSSIPPTWLSSPYFRAGNKAVISTLTGKDKTPIFTFTFSSPLTALPELAYGIKNYRGNDYLAQQYYEIKKIGLTQSTFSVSIQIYGITNIWLLTVAYLAVEPTFPHHFNTFDNVPLNYSSGPIVNISTASTQITSFTEYINYTTQAAGKTYNTFTSPLSSNTIVLFMTSLWVAGTFGKPVKFHVYSQVMSSQIYKLNTTLQINVKITNVHFSMVIFNKDDIVSSKKYQVVFEEWDNDLNGGYKEIPYEFVDNFIMGVTSFETVSAKCGFQYQWEFTNSTGVFGVQLQRSWTLTNTCGFSWSRTSMLYIRTWLCPSPYLYYNITTMMCQDFCGGYHVENTTGALCEPCTNFMCYQCDSINWTICTDCASFEHMELVNGTCACVSGYFYLEGRCVTCDTQNLGCYNCSYTILSQTLAFNASEFVCYTCNETQNYFLVSNACVACYVLNCINCTSLTNCSECSRGYIIINNGSDCQACVVVGCLDCFSNDSSLCAVCYTAKGYFLNATNQCTTVCGDGLTATGTQACDDGNNINGDGCSSTCVLQANFTCSIHTNWTTICSGVCGDGFLFGLQACDDGNNVDGDGCSADCKFEVALTLVKQQRDMSKCNSLKFDFEVKPNYAFLSTLQFDDAILMNSSALVNPSFSYFSPSLSLSYDFTEDMTLQIIDIDQNSTLMLTYPSYTFYFVTPLIIVAPENNVPANFLDQQQCQEKQYYSKAFESVKIASFVVLFASMIPGKIIGLQLFGVLQLAYFSVGSIDSVNVLLYPLMSMKQLNGYSTTMVGSSPEPLPQRVQSINYYPSFLDNFNVMFLLLLVEFTIGVILSIVNKFISSTKLQTVANKLLKEFFLTLLLFNCFNICYAAGIYFKFNMEGLFNTSFFGALISILALLAMTCAILVVDTNGFGEFKQKFKKDPVSSSYMSISILYRGMVGFLLAYSNDDDLSTLFTLGCSLFFLVYNLVNLPFAKAYHNYRACLCHLAQFITIFVAMYYRSMKSTTEPSLVAAIFSPAKLQFGLILSTLIVSVLVLIYDSYLFAKEAMSSCEKDKETKEGKKNGSDKSEMAISEINDSMNQEEQIISFVQIKPN